MIILMATAAGWAQVPQTISYQGVFTDGAGVPVADGNLILVFRIYDVPTGGTALWTESQTASVSGGIFNVVLGAGVSLNLDFDRPYWLGVSFLGTELTPRRELTASPYSLNSQAVKGSGNVFMATGNVGIGTTTPSAPLEIKHDTNLPTSAAIAIDNTVGSGPQGVIDFKFSGVTEARIRKAGGGLLFIGTLNNAGVAFRTIDTNRLTITSQGNIGVGTDSPAEKLDIIGGGIKLGTTSNTNAGTLRWTGTDFEGYNGSSWKSLTGGAGGTLPSGASGQTLRHDGADWVAASNLHNSGTRIGVGTINPSAALHVFDDLDGNTSLVIENPNPGSSSSEWIEFRDESGGLAGITTWDNDNVQFGAQMRIFNNRPQGSVHLITDGGASNLSLVAGGFVGIGTTNPVATLHVEGPTLINGATKIGSSAQDGSVEIYRNGVAAPTVRLTHTSSGGYLELIDEAVNKTIVGQGDGNGTGGTFQVYSDIGTVGFEVDGNYTGTGNPRMTLTGTSSAASFKMDQTGDASVELPTDAISSTEMLDEPGVASDGEGLAQVVLDGTVQTLLSRSISVPGPGFVLAIATCQVDVIHSNSVTSVAQFGVSDNSTSLPDNQDVTLMLDPNYPSGSYSEPVTVHGLFEATSAGSMTFYCLGFKSLGTYAVLDRQLTLVFIPTAYGTVTPTLVSAANVPDDQAPTRGGLTASEIAAERMESEAANRARIDGELAAMRAEIDELREELRRERQD